VQQVSANSIAAGIADNSDRLMTVSWHINDEKRYSRFMKCIRRFGIRRVTIPRPLFSGFSREIMLKLAYLLLSLTLATPVTALALGTDNSDYDQYILHYLGNSQSGFAARTVSNSCDALYRNSAMLLPRERAYHVCVLQNVQTVRGAFAVNEILHACRRQNQM
jgi:hypothetical protein